jgi:hypothetical protein
MHIDEIIWPYRRGLSDVWRLVGGVALGESWPSESRARINTSCPQPIYRPPNRHQPKKSPSNSVGARAVEWGRVGLYGRPRPVPVAHLWRNALTPPPPGDHKGPPHIHPTALAPTDHPTSCLASRLRLMSITADLSAPRAPSNIQVTNLKSIIGLLSVYPKEHIRCIVEASEEQQL